MANLVRGLALPERKLLAEPDPASSTANELSATHGADITDVLNRRRRQECTFRPMTNVVTGIFWFLPEFPNSSRGMNFQFPSIPGARLSRSLCTGLATLARECLCRRHRTCAHSCQRCVQERYESINIRMHILVSMGALRTC